MKRKELISLLEKYAELRICMFPEVNREELKKIENIIWKLIK